MSLSLLFSEIFLIIYNKKMNNNILKYFQNYEKLICIEQYSGNIAQYSTRIKRKYCHGNEKSGIFIQYG